MRERDEFDALLDSALSTYADPGPDSGLETRVLSRLSEASSRHRAPHRRPGFWFGWFPLAIAIPAAACLLFLWMRYAAGVPDAPSQSQAVPAAHGTQEPAHFRAPVPALTLRAATAAHRPAVPRTSSPQRAQVSPPPKLDVFPTPQPLSPEEQALAVVATQTPRPELQALIEAQKQEETPFPVAVAHIPPLEPPVSGDNNR